MVPAEGVQTWCYVVYTVLYVFLSSVGLCYKIDYNLEIKVKTMRFVLCFVTCGNFFGRERECDLGMGRERTLLHGNGKERESKNHSRTPLITTHLPTPGGWMAELAMLADR